MKDLKIYYVTENGKDTIDVRMEREARNLAFSFGLEFSGSGVEIGTGIRDIHYIKKVKK